MAKNRTVWVILGGLILLFAIGAMVMGGKKKKEGASPPPVSARAVVLPANRERTVVVPPCNTPLSTTVQNATRGVPTPGATTVQLVAGRGSRPLLVPNCQPTKTGSTTADGALPSAVFVLGDSKRPTKDQEGRIKDHGVIAESQLLLPGGSSTSTIVVGGCTKKPAENGRDTVLSAAGGSSDVAVAPKC
jgi:hypothetical protein